MQRVDAYGSDGALTVELPFNMYGDVPGRISVANGVGRRVVDTEIADQYLLQFDAFAEALIAKSPMPTPVEDAIANMAALDALALSADSGAWTAVAKA